MTSSDNDIPIIESRNLDDDTTTTGKNALGESDTATERTLAKQGIIIENEKEHPVHVEPRDQLSRELADLGGIEIMPDGEKE